jgi:hypothetical protein
MATGLERHVYGRAAGEFARVTQRHHFGMGAPGALRTPLPHHNPVFNDNSPHSRIRTANPDGEKRFFKCEL